jgi:hypothetical protein
MTTDQHVTEDPLRPNELTTGRATSIQRDEATRYLCAAAHLDPRFADSVIREFLIEPLRAIPPSPAIDAATVLREAVAARRRRLLRDWSLLAILILFAISAPVIAVAWFGFGIAVSMIGRSRTTKLVAAVVLIVGIVAVTALAPQLFSDLATKAGRSNPFQLGPFSVALGLAALALIVLDQFALSYLLTRSFRRGSFVATPTVDTWPGERWVRTVGQEDHQRELARLARADQTGDLLVYRGYRPFIGAGSQREPVTMPIPLDPKQPDGDGDEDAPPSESPSFKLADLYDHVATELLELRDSASLAPSGRLAGLTESAQVIVPIGELLVSFDDPVSRHVLPTLDQPPMQTIEPDMLAELIERPLEWMRYHRCFQLETWHRDVTVSAFLHFGVGERMLYLEWVPCVLYPIADAYRKVDNLPIEPLGPLRDGLVEWLRLPGTLLSRLGDLFRLIRPLPTRPGLVVPAKYGVANSLRELAAGRRVNNYFQDADISRYLQLLTGRMVRAVGQFLENQGIEVTEFMAQAETAGDQYVFNAPVEAASIGSHNRVTTAPKRG